MSGLVTLQREHFSVSLAAAYFTPSDLQAQTGQEQNQWRHVVLKELLDNALDAAEAAGKAPDIQVEFTETVQGLLLTITDNGPGIPPHVVEKLLEFRGFVSDKAAYRAPLRGAQGNALKTVLGIPVALGDERSHVVIEAAGIRHALQIWVSPSGEVRCDHQQTPTTTETFGTRITLAIPGPAECFFWNPTHWATAYGLFNPHARLQIREIGLVWTPNAEIARPKPCFGDSFGNVAPADRGVSRRTLAQVFTHRPHAGALVHRC